MPGNHYRTIIVPINEESIMLSNICYNGQLNAPGIKYFNFKLKVEKKEGKPTFTLYADGHYDYNKRAITNHPLPLIKSNSYQNSIMIERLKSLPFLNVWKKTEKYALV